MDFHKEADRRYAEIVASGKTIPWEAMRSHLEARAGGKKPTRPKAGNNGPLSMPREMTLKSRREAGHARE